jgi:hypothetical protein
MRAHGLASTAAARFIFAFNTYVKPCKTASAAAMTAALHDECICNRVALRARARRVERRVDAAPQRECGQTRQADELAEHRDRQASISTCDVSSIAYTQQVQQRHRVGEGEDAEAVRVTDRERGRTAAPTCV